MQVFTVLLEGGTTGKCYAINEPKIGQVVNIVYHDENGNIISKIGTIKEVL